MEEKITNSFTVLNAFLVAYVLLLDKFSVFEQCQINAVSESDNRNNIENTIFVTNSPFTANFYRKGNVASVNVPCRLLPLEEKTHIIC